VRVLLASKGNVFLEKALSAEPGVSFELIAPDGWTAALSGKFDATVFDDFTPEGWANGNALFVGRTPFDTGDAPLPSPVLTDIETTHPILRTVDLSRVTILRGRTLAVPASAEQWKYEAPLRSFEHPLLIAGEERRAGGHRVAALGFELAASDLPLRVAVPLMVSNAVHWLAGSAPEPRLPMRCGETIRLGADEKVLAPGPVAGFFQPLRNGFYEVDRGGRREWLAVNTASEEESELRGAKGGTESRKSDGPAFPALAAGWLPAWAPWRYLALLAVLLATIEWSFFHRRRTE
jgi:hypothetical protein